jgi:hypothetical protein
MSSISYLYYSDEFQLFLRSKEQDVSKTLEKLPKPPVKDIVDRFKGVFSDLNGKDIDNDITIKISGMLGFLKKVKTQLH